MSEKRVRAITASEYKPDESEQGITDICVLFNDDTFILTSVLEGSPVSFVADTLRDFADALEGKT